MHAIDRIDTMFVNEKIIRIYSFCPFSVLTTKHKTNAYYEGYHDKKKPVHLKYPTAGGDMATRNLLLYHGLNRVR